MVDWLQKKPGVIAYLRSQYTPEALPDWVGELEGDDDYREIIRKEGIDVPALDVDDGSSIDDDSSVGDGSSMVDSSEATDDEENIAQVIIPVQGSTMRDVDPKLQQPTVKRAREEFLEVRPNESPCPGLH
jgi:hypothetical protein